jgi:adenylate kinase family enzyme
MLRNEIAHGTEFGKKVKSSLAEGGYVDDDLMIELITSNLDK